LDNELILKLKHQSTWRLFFLGLITFGVYWAHYLKRQNHIINEYLDEPQKIPEGLILAIFVISYVSLFMLVPYFLVEEGHPVEKFSDLLDFVWCIGLLVWGFKARNRMNALSSNEESKNYWFSGLWTFLFSPLYFNFKINKICKQKAENA
jgi:hypothetical protein